MDEKLALSRTRLAIDEDTLPAVNANEPDIAKVVPSHTSLSLSAK